MAGPAQPLEGWRLLITRPVDGATSLTASLTALGAVVVLAPTIAFAPPVDPAPLQAVLADLTPFDWVVLTSPTAASQWLRVVATVPAGIRVAAVGAGTAAILTAADHPVHLVPERATGADLAEALPHDGQSLRFLLPRSDRALPDLPGRLQAAGHQVTEVELYRTVARRWTPDEAAAVARGVDAVVLLSPSAIDGLLAQTPPLDLAGARIVVMGPTTAAAARQVWGRVDAQAEPPSLGGLLAALLACASGDAAG